MMSKQHKWAKEIKAWADGQEIEFNYEDGVWNSTINPRWGDPLAEYRIKPQPKEPQYLYVFCDGKGGQVLRTFNAQNRHETYIGKIKLEDE
jgi:hypothetical protein